MVVSVSIFRSHMENLTIQRCTCTDHVPGFLTSKSPEILSGLGFGILDSTKAAASGTYGPIDASQPLFYLSAVYNVIAMRSPSASNRSGYQRIACGKVLDFVFFDPRACV